MYDSIKPIYHRQLNGDTRIDGTGFIVEVNGEVFFVTCAHTFNFENSNEEPFILNESEEIVITPENPLVNVGNINDVMPETLNYEIPLYQCKVPDYLIMKLEEGIVDTPLRGTLSSSVNLGDPLNLITHNLIDGEQISIECIRNTDEDSVTQPEPQLQGMLKRLDLIGVIASQNLFEGHSGGPLLNCEGEVVGYLTQGLETQISFYKFEELPLEHGLT